MAQFSNNFGSGKGITKGLWRFDGNSRDFSGNGNNGTDSNVTYPWVNGRRVASFNGSNSLITIPNSSSLTIPGNLTVSAWLNVSNFSPDTAGKQGFCIYKGVYPNYNYRISTSTTSATNEFSFAMGIGGTFYELFTAGSYKINTNYLVTGVYDGVGMKLYVNDSLVASNSHAGVVSTTTDNVYCGQYQPTGTYQYSGTTSNARVENRAWSAKEVAAYYASTKNKFGETLYAPVNPFKKISQGIAAVSNFFYAFFNQ